MVISITGIFLGIFLLRGGNFAILKREFPVALMQLISGEKDWKHVSVQKVVTLNIAVTLLA